MFAEARSEDDLLGGRPEVTVGRGCREEVGSWEGGG